MRKSYGTFKSVNDLTAIPGSGPKRLEKMHKYLTVGQPTAQTPLNRLTPKQSPRTHKIRTEEVRRG
jgi:hypothetical protein